MDRRTYIYKLLRLLKYPVYFTKTILEKIHLLKPKKFLLPDKQTSFKTNSLNNITKANTKKINKCFSIIIVLACIVTIAASYYKQNYQFKSQLHTKTNLAYQQIRESIQNIENSLTLINNLVLEGDLYLDSNKIINLLKLTNTSDEYLRLLPLRWFSLTDPNNNANKAITAFGILEEEQDEELLKILKSSIHDFLVSDNIDKNGTLYIDIVSPVIQRSTQNKNVNTIGYFKVSVIASHLLQNLNQILSTNDVIKISNEEKSIYFVNQGGSYKPYEKINIDRYSFADEINFSVKPYRISVGQDKELSLHNGFNQVMTRISIILSLGLIMILAYNYLEKKRYSKLYSENNILTEQISHLEQQNQSLNNELQSLKQDNETLSNNIDSFLISIKSFKSIEHRVNTSYEETFRKMQDHLLLKDISRHKELTQELIKDAFAKAYQISDDLSHNIIAKDEYITEVDLSDIINDILKVFGPLIQDHLIQVEQKIRDVQIKTNEVVLLQVLINLFAKVLSLIPHEGHLKILAEKKSSHNMIILTISDNGLNFSSALLKNLEHDNDFLPNMNHLYLEVTLLEKIVKDHLSGYLEITNIRKKGNHISLMLPINPSKESKIIPFPGNIKVASEEKQHG